MWLKFKNRNTLRFSITSTLLITILISLFVLLSTIFCILSINQWHNVKNSASVTLNETKLYINSEIDSYLDNSITLTTNPEFLQILKTLHPKSTQKRLDVVERISNFFDMIPINSEMLAPSFAIYSDNPTLYTSNYMYDLSKLPNSNIIDILHTINPSQPLWQFENDSPFVFYLLIDASKNSTNILRVQIDTKNINSFITTAKKDDYYISLSKPDNDTSVVSFTTLRNNSMLYSVIPIEVKYNIIFKNILIAITIFITLSGLFLFITTFLTKKLTSDIYSFIDNINGNNLSYSENVHVKKYSEFEIIENKIIELLTSINQLHSQLEAAEKQMQEIELEVMQSKFNPHLLYNTLSAVKWNLMQGTTDKLSSLIDLLTKYYRTVLNQNTIISLKEEVSLIEQYVSIMSFAHSEEYKLSLNIPDSLDNFQIMKHTLQPLVENAILHGINNKKDGVISISAHEKSGSVIITIHDNGYGMSEEKINELNADTYTSVYKNYGIRNTKNRLLLFFGKEKFQFDIESKQSEYTQIRLIINT